MDSLLTVSAPATNRKLATAATLRTELGVSDSVLPDARADDLILRASKAAEKYCGRVFAKETLAEIFRPQSWCHVPAVQRGIMQLARYPVVSVSSVVEDGTTLAAGTDYETDTVAGQVFRLSGDSRIGWSGGKVTVAYIAGYVLPGDGGTRTLPEDIEAAVLKLAAGLYFGAARDPLIKGESADGIGSVDYWVGGMPGAGGDLPPDVTALLDPYRRLVV